MNAPQNKATHTKRSERSERSKEIDRKTVEKTAALAKLSFSEDELDKMIEDMRELTAFAAILSEESENGESDTASLSSPIPFELLREDIPSGFDNARRLVELSPKSADGYFAIPKVL